MSQYICSCTVVDSCHASMAPENGKGTDKGVHINISGAWAQVCFNNFLVWQVNSLSCLTVELTKN